MVFLFLLINALALLIAAYNAAICMIFYAKNSCYGEALLYGAAVIFCFLLSLCWIMLMFAGLAYLLPGDFLLLGVNVIVSAAYSILASSAKQEMGYSAPVCDFVVNKAIPNISKFGDKLLSFKLKKDEPVPISS